MTCKKILLMHGFYPGSLPFDVKTGGLRNVLVKQGYTLCYAAVPLKGEGNFVPSDPSEVDSTFQPENRCMWIPDPQEYQYDHVIDYVKKNVTTLGPFEGIVGIAKDGAMEEVLQSNDLHKLLPDLKWSTTLDESGNALSTLCFFHFEEHSSEKSSNTEKLVGRFNSWISSVKEVHLK